MTAVLAIDTSTSCSVGLLHGKQLFRRTSPEKLHAAQDVLVMVDAVVTEANLELSDLSAIVPVTGPGSFTGLRIGIGAVQGLSQALQLPVIPVSALALLAWSANKLHANRHWMVVQQSQGQELYLGFYAIDETAGIIPLAAEQVSRTCDINVEELATILGQHTRWCAAGDGWVSVAQLMQALDINPCRNILDHHPLIEDLCRLGAILYERGCQSKELVLPNYIKEHMHYG